MKRTATFIAVVFVLSAWPAYPKSGPEIPKPAISLTEAVSIAQTDLVQNNKLKDRDVANPSDYIVMRAEYQEDSKGRWHWRIEFVHPTLNDHTALYEVGMDKRLRLLRATQ